jgi:hypothetical protein
MKKKLSNRNRIEEIKNVLKILKPNKSPGEDGIISEFYITHWEQIKDEFFLLVNDTFEKKELTPSQYKGVITLLHKSGERYMIHPSPFYPVEGLLLI